jgi:hypothetical protein
LGRFHRQPNRGAIDQPTDHARDRAQSKGACQRRVIVIRLAIGLRGRSAKPRGQSDGTGSRAGDCLISFAPQRTFVMKIVATLLALAALSLTASSASAKGCLKGAAVGGVAGHYAGHHGVLGAAAGCLYGRHRAHEQEKQQERQSQGGQAPAGQERM